MSPQSLGSRAIDGDKSSRSRESGVKFIKSTHPKVLMLYGINTIHSLQNLEAAIDQYRRRDNQLSLDIHSVIMSRSCSWVVIDFCCARKAMSDYENKLNDLSRRDTTINDPGSRCRLMMVMDDD